MPDVIVFALVVLLLVFTVAWGVQRATANAGCVDVVWTFGTGLTGLAFLIVGEGRAAPRLAAGVLLAIWCFRLGGHILRRVMSEGAEDGRYAAMRAEMGKRAQPMFLLIFWLQAGLAWAFALPFYEIGRQPVFYPVALVAGVLIGALGVLGEGLADRQLRRFKARPDSHGKTCREGLWRYSRHPNYFFEWLHWCGYPLIAVGADLYGWFWLLPIAMFLFLWFVTGIPHTERQALKSRGDDYRDYQRTTSPFFPWRPGS